MNVRWTRILGLVLTLVGWTCGAAFGDELEDAVQGDAATRAVAIARLREQGPAGLARVLERRLALRESLSKTADPAEQAASLAALDQTFDPVLDAVGGARHTRESGLYWYTDLEQAKTVARAAGKPILALRLLGNLTDDYSCANSRFFRAILYPNREIAQYLRENYILSWKSVRPAPRITIDFGDGRKLERTITGNSIHYVLNADGTVIDAIPGLHGPQAFLHHLTRARDLAHAAAAQPPESRTEFLRESHRQALRRTAERWEADLLAVLGATEGEPRTIVSPTDSEVRRTRVASVPVEGVTNAEILHRLRSAAAPTAAPDAKLDPQEQKFATLERLTTEEAWLQIAALHAQDAKLDDAARGVVASHKPNAAQAGRLALTKKIVEDPLLRVVRNLERSVALDTVKNEYQMHRKLHAWLAAGFPFTAQVETLNDVVYENVFLTPGSDPWLGLAPPDVYAALPNSGIVTPPPAPPASTQAAALPAVQSGQR